MSCKMEKMPSLQHGFFEDDCDNSNSSQLGEFMQESF